MLGNKRGENTFDTLVCSFLDWTNTMNLANALLTHCTMSKPTILLKLGNKQ